MIYEEKTIETIPVGPLGLIPLKSCAELGAKVDAWLVEWRKERESEHKSTIAFAGYQKDSYIIEAKTPRFGSGEAKGTIEESVRGDDLYFLVDVCNNSLTYSLCGMTNHMSPDDHFQDLKRVIGAIGGKARRVNVIMPYLYESRQDIRNGRESLDCATALQELVSMGVENIITFDAHDPRVANAAPLNGFDNFTPPYQFIRSLLRHEKDLVIDKDHMTVISPDEGALDRAVYFSSVLGVDTGMFYKRRDYSRVVNGKNPIVAHEFLGDSLKGRDVVVIDDMIASGGSMIDTAKQIKQMGAKRVFICCTFGLFTEGFKSFDNAYEKGYFDRVVCTNLTYLPPEIYEKPYFVEADMSKFTASIIDFMNHDLSMGNVLTPTQKIQEVLRVYNEKGIID